MSHLVPLLEFNRYPFRKEISLASSKFEPVGGFAYSYPLPRNYSPRGAQTVSARLRENDTILSPST